MTVTVHHGKSDPDAMKKALKQVELLMLEGNDQTFRNEGPGWTPLSLATLANRRRGRGSFGVKILQDTGTLKNSMTDITGSAKGSYRFNNGVDRVEVGTKLIYGPTHQYGRKQGDGFIPARPFATIPSEYRSKIRKAIAKGFIESL